MLDAAILIFCPDREYPPDRVKRIIDTDLAIFDLPPHAHRFVLGKRLVCGFTLHYLGLWAHHGGTVLAGLVLTSATAAVLWWFGRS
ncbi:hypothetical protein JQU17_12375 [Ponticoccus sp. SC2-23]|uniref:hypothetical protein n=1 Tax=Alexandriicola marinus TaxID=2081710 RepID=UPI000FD80504|nr:hypothetical protein [Alexandriicola marinus]MBM1221022.1 hypothetical protein [Ponticoccus sp. SC6-9]MBM1225592.1 hypothetical protein [Ponticoccus sp. SC6-15]MBM1227744.1 hypothetical protein [Ponticoccus sp. SC6-38]MBM1234618.1 hypothetical protein [Ponticoccus sp. SC6-45]MBM1238246.1 hypothetical protein [Ponticoccus sp. SC6-49]MBM1243515.1 hypothetical protein [Ponticoccus sp. SC2-64]MBM1248142.1 hypothetical protein [Ponticoccus sp. SC6-42]MBM1252646.1 hypothetical protein [Pontico